MMSLFQTDKTKLMMFVLDKYNVQYNPSKYRWQKVRCFNEYGHKLGDRNPSASVSLEYGYYQCHACEMEGDGYSILRKMEGWDVKKVNDAFGGEPIDEDEDVWI